MPTKIPADFFVETDKLILKFIWKFKGHKIANTIMKKNKVRGHTSPILKPGNSKQDSVVLAYDRLKDQWKRTENTEINPHIYGQLIFNNSVNTIQWGKDSLFNKWSWDNWISTCIRMKLNFYLTSYTKVNSERFIGLPWWRSG